MLRVCPTISTNAFLEIRLTWHQRNVIVEGRWYTLSMGDGHRCKAMAWMGVMHQCQPSNFNRQSSVTSYLRDVHHVLLIFSSLGCKTVLRCWHAC
mmetsp:Transcript_7478/g.45937  ORF Transcript_7478/g.45937 Transcript_7478/m.45937 type:complete len:95 (+) Transcript_7478:394-678(+)